MVSYGGAMQFIVIQDDESTYRDQSSRLHDLPITKEAMLDVVVTVHEIL